MSTLRGNGTRCPEAPQRVGGALGWGVRPTHFHHPPLLGPLAGPTLATRPCCCLAEFLAELTRVARTVLGKRQEGPSRGSYSDTRKLDVCVQIEARVAQVSELALHRCTATHGTRNRHAWAVQARKRKGRSDNFPALSIKDVLTEMLQPGGTAEEATQRLTAPSL